MARFTRWLRYNYDAVITLVVAAVALVLRLLGLLGDSQTSPVILGVVGLLAFTIIRERRRTETADHDTHVVRLLNSDDIRREFDVARRHASQWTFKGGTGTYLRAMTLPLCIQNAVRERRLLRIQVEIIDPTNEALCGDYAGFRALWPDGTGDPWTPIRARNEAYATILAACWYLQRYKLLTIAVALSATVPTFRWDLVSDCVIVTHEDPSPHLMFGKSSPYYNWYHRELEYSFRQARYVPLESARTIRLSEEPTTVEVRNVFHELGLELPSTMTVDEVGDIVRRALHAKNPYP